MTRGLDKGVLKGINRRKDNERSGHDKGGKLTVHYVHSLHCLGLGRDFDNGVLSRNCS